MKVKSFIFASDTIPKIIDNIGIEGKLYYLKFLTQSYLEDDQDRGVVIISIESKLGGIANNKIWIKKGFINPTFAFAVHGAYWIEEIETQWYGVEIEKDDQLLVNLVLTTLEGLTEIKLFYKEGL